MPRARSTPLTSPLRARDVTHDFFSRSSPSSLSGQKRSAHMGARIGAMSAIAFHRGVLRSPPRLKHVEMHSYTEVTSICGL